MKFADGYAWVFFVVINVKGCVIKGEENNDFIAHRLAQRLHFNVAQDIMAQKTGFTAFGWPVVVKR